MKLIDVPPVWLLLFLLATWLQTEKLSVGLSFGGAWADFLGGILVGGGVLLNGLALREFIRYSTTILPHKTPSCLIQTGIFSRTRNPIYLGDVMILAGLVFWWDAVLSLALIPIFVWIMERRFIVKEENRMRREFKLEFARYERMVRRWI
ncbi:MAG: isoprenylcysteine carboxylmethyltransferase family protein [Aestuariivita sp.]|nr:isoprenylcysteine carboxylmethyltransferase family protein [Aestuariivita sp.]MCY4201165.1 isoprenylcysteine carboxylmethyltransferase family protein [Aestuariivita sp.]MCY4287347.1 isoprenylcysteine carboxylmethyltransferase family protein [Aestuariivita sp.]MCY4346603.1 isoprenylcysteine carboxylmethyltransferase family protein [Aestuariivita sp.]